MPIIIQDFFWKQTDEIVIIQVPLKQVNRGALDVFTFENYIKVHYPPFLYEVFLFDKIRDDKSKCSIKENELVFELIKKERRIWCSLEAYLTKEEKSKLREEIIVKSQVKAKEETEAKAVKKDKRKRAAVREQMTLDTAERDYVDNVKESIKKSATEDIEKWKASTSERIGEDDDDVKDGETDEEEEDKNDASIISINKESCKLISENILTSHCGPPVVDREQKLEKATTTCKKNYKKHDIFCDKIEEPKFVPIPRESGRITVSFTPRAFPTPARESIRAEEEEWLKKQAEARRVVGFKSEDLKPEEQNPIWLKDKGDDFFKKGNYLGALSAYSHAIKLGSKLPSIYSNRAAAHLAVGNYYKAHEDCSMALELLTPCVSLNARSRARCLARRATALCRLDCLNFALRDLKEAEQLAPDVVFKVDIDKINSMIANHPPSDSED